jgi:ankyrin repeat protein
MGVSVHWRHNPMTMDQNDVILASHQFLIEKGALVDLPTAGNGYTPLHDAVSGDHFETAKILVDAGAQLDLGGHSGLTPRDIAKANGNDNMLKLLTRKER